MNPDAATAPDTAEASSRARSALESFSAASSSARPVCSGSGSVAIQSATLHAVTFAVEAVLGGACVCAPN